MGGGLKCRGGGNKKKGFDRCGSETVEFCAYVWRLVASLRLAEICCRGVWMDNRIRHGVKEILSEVRLCM